MILDRRFASQHKIYLERWFGSQHKITCGLVSASQRAVRDIAKYDPGTDMTSGVNHLVYDAFGRATSGSNPSRRRQPAVGRPGGIVFFS